MKIHAGNFPIACVEIVDDPSAKTAFLDARLLRRRLVFHDIPMLLSENDAAKIILVRSVEECDKKFFSDQIVLDALAAGKNAEPGLAWVKARAQFLFDHLSPSYQTVRQIARLPSPWTASLCSLMLVLGFLTNLLGPAEKIHVVRNPVLLLVAWNLLVYLALAVWGISRPSTSPRGGRPRFAGEAAAKPTGSAPCASAAVGCGFIAWDVEPFSSRRGQLAGKS